MLVGRCNIYRSNPSRMPSLERHFIPFFLPATKRPSAEKRREMCATLSHVSQTIDLFKKPLPFFAGPKNVDTRQRGTFFIGSEQTLQMGGDWATIARNLNVNFRIENVNSTSHSSADKSWEHHNTKGGNFPWKKRGKDLTDFSYLSKMEAAAIFLSAGCGNSLHLSLDNWLSK